MNLENEPQLHEIAAGVLLLLGAFFIFLAALGVYRMPDVFLKCHTSSKASTFGKIFTFGALACYFWQWQSTLKATIVIIFLFSTLPAATHLLTRAISKRKAP